MSRTRHHHHRRMRWSGPNWYHHMFAERCIRPQTNRLCRQMVLLVDIETALLLPHYKHNGRGYFY